MGLYRLCGHVPVSIKKLEFLRGNRLASSLLLKLKVRLPKFPRFKKHKPVRYIPLGTRLLKIGEDLRTQLSAGPVDATPAERSVYGWLVRFGIPFVFQQPLMGGRAVPGGAVVDFIIFLEQPPLIIRVMSYWHTDPTQSELDKIQEMVLEQEGFRVEDIWEWETMDWRMLSRKLEELIFGRLPTYAAPIEKPPYVSPSPECPYTFEQVCWGVDC